MWLMETNLNRRNNSIFNILFSHFLILKILYLKHIKKNQKMWTSFLNMLATLWVFLLLHKFDCHKCQTHRAYQAPLYHLCANTCAGSLYITDTKLDFYVGLKMWY